MTGYLIYRASDESGTYLLLLRDGEKVPEAPGLTVAFVAACQSEADALEMLNTLDPHGPVRRADDDDGNQLA